MRTLRVPRLVEGEEFPGPLAADLPVGGQGGALEGPPAAQEEGDRLDVALAMTLVQHGEINRGSQPSGLRSEPNSWQYKVCR